MLNVYDFREKCPQFLCIFFVIKVAPCWAPLTKETKIMKTVVRETLHFPLFIISVSKFQRGNQTDKSETK